MPTTRAFFLSLLGFLLAATVAFGQITGEIRGVVLDPSEAGVSQAKVILKSVETGVSREQQVTGEGRFVFSLLNIGTYQLRAEAPNFRVTVAEVLVKTGEVASVQLRLALGAITETVTVSGAVARLDTENAQIQMSVIGEQIQNIPVGRNPNLFALTAPGVAPASRTNPYMTSGTFNVNGGRGRGDNVTVDGITVTDITTAGTDGILDALNFAAIKEVKVITNNFSAEYGRNSTSQVLYITKSGTNQLRGEVYEFVRNDKLNSRPFFDTTGKANIVRFNTYGFEVGGPAFLPRIYDGRNKTFWHVAYEGLKKRGAGATRIARVPTPDMVAAVTDPTAKALIEQYKLPSDPSGSIQTQAPDKTDAYKLSVRADQQIGAQDTVWGRYSRNRSTDATSALTFLSTNLLGFSATSTVLAQQAALQEVHLFSPTVVNEFRFGFERSTGGFPIDTPYPLGPRIVIASGEVNRFGMSETFPQGRTQSTYQFTNNLSFMRGAHNLKAGLEYNYALLDSFQDAYQRPVLTFASWADFAAGRPTTYQQYVGSSLRTNRVKNVFGFFRDDWKVSPNLTVNLGARYEWAGGPTEANGMISNLNLNNTDAYGSAGAGPFGLIETGKPSFRGNNNWAPRLGFAWAVGGDRKTVVRGGYGIAYDFIFLNPIINQRFLPPFIIAASLSGQASFAGTNSLASIVAGTAQIQADTKAQVGKLSTTVLNFGSVSAAIDQGIRNAQAQQWNFGVEREVLGLVVKASYVGTKGNYLPRARNINLIAQRVSPATSLADETARLSQFQTANSGLSGGATKYSNRIDRRYNTITLFESSANSNYHSAQFEVERRLSRELTLRANYTFSKSIDDNSDAMGTLFNDSGNQQNPLDNRDDRGPSQFDLRHRLVITHTWEMPFFKRSPNGFLRLGLGGWAFSGITSFRSGFPVTLDAGPRRGLATLTVLGGGSAIRPNVSGPVNIEWKPFGSPGAPNATTNPDGVQAISSYAASLGLSQPLLGNFGTMGRNVLRLNGETNFDLNLYKTFQVQERMSVQIRAEMYNAFNNTSFEQVDRTITSPTFGQYTAVGQDARYFQLGARLIF
jgi:hypothetical protein